MTSGKVPENTRLCEYFQRGSERPSRLCMTPTEGRFTSGLFCVYCVRTKRRAVFLFCFIRNSFNPLQASITQIV